jgi:hypothetical protein
LPTRPQVEELRRQYDQHQADIQRRRDIPLPGNAIKDTIAAMAEVQDLQVASNVSGHCIPAATAVLLALPPLMLRQPCNRGRFKGSSSACLHIQPGHWLHFVTLRRCPRCAAGEVGVGQRPDINPMPGATPVPPCWHACRGCN